MSRRGTRRIWSRQVAGRALTAAGLVFLPACGSTDSATGTQPVRGHVFVNGRPAAGALVVFVPADGPQDRTRPRGYVDSQGAFTLTTFALNDGAPVGNYRVAVIWREREDEDDPPGRYLAPRKYAAVESSGLWAEVRPGVSELPPFELTK